MPRMLTLPLPANPHRACVSTVYGYDFAAGDSFSWKGVALSAVGGAVTAGVSAGVGSSLNGLGSFGAGVVKGAVGSVLTQGIGVATGLQQSFSWKNVAASAIAQGTGAQVADWIGQAQYDNWGDKNLDIRNDWGNTAVRGIGSGLAAGVASAAVRGGSVRQQLPGILQDVIASTIGNTIAGQLAAQPTTPALDQPQPKTFTQDGEERIAANPIMKMMYGSSNGNGAARNLNPVAAYDPTNLLAPAELDDPLGDFIGKNMPAWEKQYADAIAVPHPGTEVQNDTRAAVVSSMAARNGDPNNIIDAKRPGLYSMENVRGQWVATQEVGAVTTDKAAINGMLNTPSYAAWLMGKHVEQEFPGTSKFTLFYNPTEGALADGWESLRDKLGLTTEISKQFASVLSQVQASGQKVDWVAHSQGGIIFSESARISGADLSNNSVVFHAGGNNELVTNSIMQDSHVRVIGYRDNPFDPVPNIAGLNTLNPVKILGAALSLPAVIWGGPESSPHTMPYVEQPKK